MEDLIFDAIDTLTQWPILLPSHQTEPGQDLPVYQRFESLILGLPQSARLLPVIKEVPDKFRK